MPQILTQASVGKLTTTTRKLVADGGCKGLYVDVRPTNSVYVFRYTDPARKQRVEQIGPTHLLKLSEARQMASGLARRLVLGEDLKASKIASQVEAPKLMTFSTFFEERYLPQARITRRSLAAEISTVNRNVLPVIGDKPLREVTRGQVTALIHGLAAKGQAATTVNRTLAHIKAIFNRAIEWEIDGIEKNPAKGVKPLPDHKRHERYLSAEEAQQLLQVVSKSQNKLLPYIVALLLLTGCRRREVLEARWEYIDLERGLLTIPLSKSGKPRYVPLSPAARNILIKSKLIVIELLGSEEAGNGWVFPNPKTKKPFVKMQTGWMRARRLAGLEGLRVHDLRHSFASALVNRGMTLYDVKEALGHSSVVTTQRYAHLAPQRLMQAACEAQAHYNIEMLHISGPAE
jgi:integrase